MVGSHALGPWLQALAKVRGSDTMEGVSLRLRSASERTMGELGVNMSHPRADPARHRLQVRLCIPAVRAGPRRRGRSIGSRTFEETSELSRIPRSSLIYV